MHTLNRTLSVWEDVLVQLRRKSVSWQGISLSEGDRNTFTEALVMCAIHLIDMSKRFDGIGSEREIIAWAHFVCTLDVSQLGSCLSDVVQYLRHVSRPTTLNSFKREFRDKYPFIGGFIAPIRGLLDSFLGSPCHRGFYPCYQFFSFLTHLNLRDISLDLEPEYEELEALLHTYSYSGRMIDEMNLIMREWLSSFRISEENFHPQHGPGATAELTAEATFIDKYQYLGTDSLIDYVFKKHAGVDVTTYFPLPCVPWKRESKVVFVPKSMKTKRTISKEPTTLQFLQQGIWKCLRSYIHKHPVLKSHIDFRHQDKNSRLAIRSSRTHQYATIDLSSASDTVTYQLVKAVFRNTPLYPFLVALRSRTAELPSGKVVELAKYAPMGSALCFPVESLIFACAVEYAVRRARRTHLGSFPLWRVYGDDIIVEDALFQDVLLVLEGLGFFPNHSKSFSSPARFRESCGGEGYDGVDVTPMKIPRRFRSVRGRITPRHAADFMGLIDMANSCHKYQFSLLRAWIIRVLLDNPIAPPLFSGTGRGAIWSPIPDNYRAESRFSPDKGKTWFQEWQIAVAKACSVEKSSTYSRADDVRYFETLRLIDNRSGDMFDPAHRVCVPCGPATLRLRKRWISDPSGALKPRHLNSLVPNLGGEVDYAN